MSNAADRPVATIWSIPPAWPATRSDTGVRMAPTPAVSWVLSVGILLALAAPWRIPLIPGTSPPLGPPHPRVPDAGCTLRPPRSRRARSPTRGRSASSTASMLPREIPDWDRRAPEVATGRPQAARRKRKRERIPS